MLSPDDRPPLLSPRTYRFAAALLLLFGVQVWLVFARGMWGRDHHFILLAGALIVAAVPIARRSFVRIVDTLRQPTERQRWLVAIGVAAVAFTYFVFTAFLQRRDLTPIFADDFSYLLQIRMLASTGRLWMPAHPLADFFEATHILVQPVYTSIYFSGASMLYAPMVWLNLPAWVLPALVAAAVVGLTYRVVVEAVDGVAGLYGAAMLAALPWYRAVGMMVGSRIPLMFFGLVSVWAWMRWRRGTHHWPWAVVIGAAMGWAAITRPLDALCFAIPIGVAMLVDIVRTYRSEISNVRFQMLSCVCVIIGALPFLSVQLILNHRVTGQWLRSPFTEYAERDYPQTAYGFHGFDPARRPESRLPQKQRMYDRWVAPFVKEHRLANVPNTWIQRRLPMIAQVALPHPLMWILVPAGLLGMRGARRWVIFGVVPLFIVGYAFYAFFLQPYTLMMAPAMAMCVMLGVEALNQAWPRARAFLTTFFLLAIAALTVAQLPEFNRFVLDQEWPSPFRRMDAQLRRLGPSIVLFDASIASSEADDDSVSRMAVYNTGSAWPDDSYVIRAHDLGPRRNVELFRYYAARSPRRMVYRYDQRSDALHELGWAEELLAGPTSSPTPR